MSNPQERIIKKMIDNIVEQNKPVFEKPAAAPTSAATASAPAQEDGGTVSRKIEYGFSSMRQEHAELRRLLEELSGAVKMLRNDMDGIRMTLQQQARAAHTQQETPAPRPQASAGVGAPQYRKSEADEAYEQQQGGQASMPQVQQARGFAKKEEQTEQVDISKVFYYGKK